MFVVVCSVYLSVGFSSAVVFFFESIKINPEKIGNVIRPGGKIIKGIQAETGAEINIEDDGTVRIYAIKKESLDRALEMVENITAEIEIDKIYQGKVVSTTNFGAFMEVLPGQDGMIMTVG